MLRDGPRKSAGRIYGVGSVSTPPQEIYQNLLQIRCIFYAYIAEKITSDRLGGAVPTSVPLDAPISLTIKSVGTSLWGKWSGPCRLTKILVLRNTPYIFTA